jgi:hypothetical protein
MNDDGDWWVPVEGVSFKEARSSVISCLSYSIPEDGTLIYKGKSKAWLDCEHEGGCPEDCPTNFHVMAYHFEENPKW